MFLIASCLPVASDTTSYPMSQKTVSSFILRLLLYQLTKLGKSLIMFSFFIIFFILCSLLGPVINQKIAMFDKFSDQTYHIEA